MKPYTRIEFPCAGMTYRNELFGVYRYDTFPRSSVLAGQTRRSYLGSFETEAEARTAHPEAEAGVHGCGYQPPAVSHLPGPDDPDPFGDFERGDW